MPDDDDDQDNDANTKTEDMNGEKKNQSGSKTKKIDKGEAFRREMAQVQFRNFVHEQQFYSWQFRSGRLYGRGEDTREVKEMETKEGESNA